MKRVIFYVVQWIVCVSVSFAQPKQIVLNGNIAMTTGEVFPFKIEVTEAAGTVIGYSYTYKEPNETKAVINGTLNRKLQTLDFRETEIVYSHGYVTRAYMCLVNAHLEYRQSGVRGSVLTGSLTSTELDKTSCTAGTITFKNDEEIQNLFGYHEQYDTVISMKKKPKETYIPPAPATVVAPEPPLLTEKVTAGIEKSYEWYTDTVIVDIWDGGNIDGDRLSVSFNDKPYLTNYYLLKEKRQLRIPITGTGVNTLTITADNEGSDPPNTATLLLTDGVKHYSVIAYNPKGQQAVIKIKKMR